MTSATDGFGHYDSRWKTYGESPIDDLDMNKRICFAGFYVVHNLFRCHSCGVTVTQQDIGQLDIWRLHAQ